MMWSKPLVRLYLPRMCLEGTAPPPPPEEPQLQSGMQSQAYGPAQTQRMQVPSITPTPMDVSQDEVLQEWSQSPDELKRQWAAWYISNPQEWIEYKSQYANKQTQQREPEPKKAENLAVSQPPVLIHSAQGATVQQNPYSQPPATRPHEKQTPEKPHQDLAQQPGIQQQPWQQPSWQQQQEAHQQYPLYHQPGDNTGTQQWPPQSNMHEAQVQQPASISSTSPARAPPHAAQQSTQQPPWVQATQPGAPSQSQQQPYLKPEFQAMPPGVQRAANGDTARPHEGTTPWSAAHPPSGHAAFSAQGTDAPWVQESTPHPDAPNHHAMSQVPWSSQGPSVQPSPPAVGRSASSPVEHQGPHVRANLGPGLRPMAQERPVPGRNLAPNAAPVPRQGSFAGAAPATGGDADWQPHRGGSSAQDRGRPGDRPQGFVRGVKSQPVPTSQPALPAHSVGAGRAPAPNQLQGDASGAPAGFAMAQAGQQPSGGPGGNMVHAQVPQQQWPTQTARPPQPPGAPQPWLTGGAPRGMTPGLSGSAAQLPGPPGPPGSFQRPARPGPWLPAPPPASAPVNSARPPAPGPWQAPPARVEDSPNVRPRPPSSVGVPKQLPGGMMQTPPGAPKGVDMASPGMQAVPSHARPLPRAEPPGPRMMAPGVRPSSGPQARPPMDHAGADGVVRPPGEYSAVANRPGGSPTPRPGAMYGVHSPQPKSRDGAQLPAGRGPGLPPPQRGAVSNLAFSSVARPPPDAMPRGPGAPRSFPGAGRPAGAPGMMTPDRPQGPGLRPAGFMGGPQPAPGPQFPGAHPGRPQMDLLNGPRGPMPGPNMQMRPGVPNPGMPRGPPRAPFMMPFPNAMPPR